MWTVKTLEDHFCKREPRTTDCTHLQGLSTFSDLNNTCLGLMFLLSPVPLSFALCRHYLQFLTQVILLGTPKPAAWLIHVSRLGFHTVIASFRQELAQDSPLAVKRVQMPSHYSLSQSEGCCPPCRYHRQHQHHSHCDLLNVFLVSHTS